MERAALSTPSLRAQRSNPESIRGGSLDCFVAEPVIGPAEGGTRWLLAMTRHQIAAAQTDDPEHQTHLRILAACFARALLVVSPSQERGRREDRAPAGTRGPCARTCTRLDHRLNRDSPAFPARMVLTGSFVISPVRRAQLPPSPRGFFWRFTPVGVKRLRGLDASVGRQDHTTSPSAHVFAGLPAAGVCSPSRPCEDAFSAVSFRAADVSRGPAQSSARPAVTARAPTLPASTASHTAFVTTYDRPFTGWDERVYTIIPNSDKENYFRRGGLTAS